MFHLRCFIITLAEKADISILHYWGTITRDGCARLFRYRGKDVHSSIVREANRCRRSTLKAVTRGAGRGRATRTSHAHEEVVVARRWKKGLKTANKSKNRRAAFPILFAPDGALHTRRRGAGSAFKLLTRLRKYF